MHDVDDARREPASLPAVREVLEPLLAAQRFEWVGDHRQVTAHRASGSRFLSVG